MDNILETITNMENKPSNNKILREAFKMVFPYGTIPKNVDKLKNEIILLIKYKVINKKDLLPLKKEDQKLYDNTIIMIKFIEDNLK